MQYSFNRKYLNLHVNKSGCRFRAEMKSGHEMKEAKIIIE